MKPPGFPRRHLVESHGYNPRYVAVAALQDLAAEHDRLHDDDTAGHLDHEHKS